MRKMSVSVSSRMVLIVVAIIILLHLVVLVVYTQKHTSTQREARRDQMIQKIMNVLHMVQATPPTQVSKAIKAMDEPGLDVKLTAKPLWPLKFYELSFWGINRVLHQHVGDLSMSLRLDNAQWLNIKATIGQRAWLAQTFLLFVEGVVAFAILFYAWTLSRFTGPLKEFKQAAERLGVDMDAPLMVTKAYGPAIVKETAHAMNQMQQRIRDLIRDRTQMLGAISHDLRTPITRLKLRAQLIKDQQLSDQITRDLDEMESMIAESLTFARNAATSERHTKLDLDSLLSTLCDDMLDLGYKVEYAGADKRVSVEGRPITLKRAFTNLIENAVKYGEIARVKLVSHNGQAVITVDDNGPGIPEDQLTAVFAPFYRCDRSRSRDIGGTGLGLAVAADAVRIHHGDIVLINLPQGGLRARVSLPLA